MVYINTGKSYEHYNRALGKQIRSKRHYEEELKRGGFVSKEAADAIVREKTKRTPWTPSQKVRDIVNSCHADKQGNVKMPDRAIRELERMGVTFDKTKIDSMTKEREASP